jgi:hypothetical protein
MTIMQVARPRLNDGGRSKSHKLSVLLPLPSEESGEHPQLEVGGVAGVFRTVSSEMGMRKNLTGTREGVCALHLLRLPVISIIH